MNPELQPIKDAIRYLASEVMELRKDTLRRLLVIPDQERLNAIGQRVDILLSADTNPSTETLGEQGEDVNNNS